jgi:hypothetical protein
MELDTRPGVLANEEYFQQLCYSIIDDLEHNNFHWEGNEHGVHLTINGQSQFIPNEADEEKEISKLWKKAKHKLPKTS